MTLHCPPTMEDRRRELEVGGEGVTGQKEVQALLVSLFSPAVSRRRVLDKKFFLKGQDGSRGDRKTGCGRGGVGSAQPSLKTVLKGQ